MSNYTKKSGHPVLGIVLGILGIVAALFLCFIGGVIGGAIAGILGIAALLIGLSSRKSGGKGIGAIITGALAILLAVALTISSVNMFKMMKEKAEETGEAPLVAEFLSKPELGFVGMILNIPQDEANLQELLNQMDKVR